MHLVLITLDLVCISDFFLRISKIEKLENKRKKIVCQIEEDENS